MNAKHTPGPWIINPYAKRSVIAPMYATSPKAIAMLQGRINCDDEVRDANGRLITAAPDLLKELQSMCRAYVRLLETARFLLVMNGNYDPLDKMEADDQNLVAAKAAIAKAIGGAA